MGVDRRGRKAMKSPGREVADLHLVNVSEGYCSEKRDQALRDDVILVFRGLSAHMFLEPLRVAIKKL
jgi:hypothetical protein